MLLVGAGHSAHTAARDLARLAEQAPGTRVIWSLRDLEPAGASSRATRCRSGRAWPPRRQRSRRESSAAVDVRRGAVVEQLSKPNGQLRVALRNAAGPEKVEVDRILSFTGSVGDHGLYRQLQVHECYATCGPMKLSAALFGRRRGGDCLTQTSHGADTLTNPEPSFFILGSKSYGRNNTFLMRVGWEQVGEVFGLLS